MDTITFAGYAAVDLTGSIGRPVTYDIDTGLVDIASSPSNETIGLLFTDGTAGKRVEVATFGFCWGQALAGAVFAKGNQVRHVAGNTRLSVGVNAADLIMGRALGTTTGAGNELFKMFLSNPIPVRRS